MAAPAKVKTAEIIRKAEQAQRVKLAAAYSMLLIASALVVVIFGGDRFSGVRDTLGISRFMAEKKGLYSNCNRDANGNRFCGQKSIDERVGRRNTTNPSSSIDTERIDYSRRPGDFVPFRLGSD